MQTSQQFTAVVEAVADGVTVTSSSPGASVRGIKYAVTARSSVSAEEAKAVLAAFVAALQADLGR